MSEPSDRLYDLLPVVYRQRDADQGYPLRALLRIITEQVDVVEDDMAQLYADWFIETCADWVVPYIGDLVGYRIVYEAGEPGRVATPRERLRNKILIPRREVANTVRYRRRKGTLALLELLANDVAGWPARAVEFYKLLGWTQALNHLRPAQGRTVDLRRGDALDRLDGPFDTLAHTVDVRRIASHRSPGRYNIPTVGVFVWRLKAYPVLQTPAYCLEEVAPNCYTFSVLGNDTPLYTRPQPEPEPTHIAGEMNLPVPIRRRAFEDRMGDYYGLNLSLGIWLGSERDGPRRLIRREDVIASDLSDWQYRPPQGKVAVDPARGRIVFHPRELPKHGVWVAYHYGFSADIGGGIYDRSLSQPAGATLYQVGEAGELRRINQALAQWRSEKPQHAVIEITDSGVYVEPIYITLEEGQSLQLRAANRTRPVIRLLDWQTDRPDDLSVTGGPGSRFTLDGIMITGRGVQIEGPLTEVTIRHSTLVPGWGLRPDCEPRRPAEPSLELFNTEGTQVTIEHSIVGSIQVNLDEVEAEPVPIHVTDSVVDATRPENEALGAPGWPLAHAVLTVARSTVFGQIQTHAIDLAENTLFVGLVHVGRRQRGCMRFCYVVPGSRTPRRYRCQPDLQEEAVVQRMPEATKAEIKAIQRLERERVRPEFNSVRYGTPTYCQLTTTCAQEITRGADDESEMGVFHDLYQPQRAANLRARLEEYTPAGMEAGAITAS
ncbi:MAG: hypothetical protein PVI59_08885 [Anaerolineae bacterium]|jgi:hypothetical protein